MPNDAILSRSTPVEQTVSASALTHAVTATTFRPSHPATGPDISGTTAYLRSARNPTSLVSSKPSLASLPPLADWHAVPAPNPGECAKSLHGAITEVLGLNRALRYLPTRPKKELRRYTGAERDALFTLGAWERGYGLFGTINLRDDEEADDVLHNLRRAVERETGHYLEWRGVEVPALLVSRSLPPDIAGQEPPPPPFRRQRHAHVIFNVRAGTPEHRAIQAFGKRRNKGMPRSVKTEEVCTRAGGIAGLIRYVNGPKNGGALLESRGTRAWMEELGRRDWSTLKRGTYRLGATPNDPPRITCPAHG